MSYETLSAEQRVQRCTLSILTHRKYRSMAGVLMMGVTYVEPDPSLCPTAYTDGINKTYGEAAVLRWAEPEMRFVILHETLHVALRHMLTWLWMWKKDPQLANMACDYVINLLLCKSDAGEGFISMPKEGLVDEKYEGMDSGEVFRLLEKDKQDGKMGKPRKGFDTHGWEAAKGRTAEEVKGLEKQVADAVQGGSVLVGNSAGDLQRALGEEVAHKVDWREELREFVMTHCSGGDISTWRRPHRRSIDSGIYTPSTYSESVGRLVVGTDTSGSIQGVALNQFLSEVAGIGRLTTPEVLDLLYWDSRVAAHEKYGPGQYEMLRQSTKPKGGGGTRPSCVTQYLKEHNIRPACVVMLTDGEVGSDWGGAWPCPVLWCVLGNKRVTAKVGKTIHI